MSDTLYEKSNTGDDGFATWYGANWEAETFTPSITHTITSVKLLMYRDDGELPGTITLSIRGTTANLPSGADLCSGTTNGNTLEITGVGEWREITLGAGTLLIAGTKYAKVFRAITGDASNRVRSRVTNPGTYSGGSAVYSSDSGVNWTDYGTFDYQFEEYGIGIAGEGMGLIVIQGTNLHYVDANGDERYLTGTLVT